MLSDIPDKLIVEKLGNMKLLFIKFFPTIV